MSPEIRSFNQSLSPPGKSRFKFADISGYYHTRMDDYPHKSPIRIAVYFLEGILIGLFTYLWLEYAQMGKLYHWLFPIIVSLSIVMIHYTITEIAYKICKPIQRTIGLFWLISFAGLVASFILVYLSGICGFICQVTGSYCPVSWHASPPETVTVFFKTAILPWLISISLLTQGIIKQELAKELANIKHINESLGRKKAALQSQNSPVQADGGTGQDSFSIPLKEGIKQINFRDIYFIAVEDHYCKIVFNSNGEICNEYVRLALKDALGSLPSSYFAQVHRSYAVNLRHVKQIKKEGQSYQLFIEGSTDFLPASRHRAPIFLPKLQEMLS